MKTSIKGLYDDLVKKDPEILNTYKRYYGRLLSGFFKTVTYLDRVGHSLVFIIKIPSSSDKYQEVLSYDVVITMDNSKVDGESIMVEREGCQFFSNAPSFAYKYAYVYNKEDIIVPWLSNRYPEIFFKQAPKKTNPSEEVDLDITLKLAVVHLYKTLAGKKNVNTFLMKELDKDRVSNKEIRSFDTIMKEYSNRKKKKTNKPKSNKPRPALSTSKNKEVKKTVTPRKKTIKPKAKIKAKKTTRKK